MGQRMSQEATSLGKSLAAGAGKGAVKMGKMAGRAARHAPIIPAGRDASGKRQFTSLAGMQTAAGSKFKESRLGRSALFSKEARSDYAAKRQIAALEATGQMDQAKLLRKKMAMEGSKSMGEKYSSDQLRKISGSDKVSQLDRQRAMLALASRGDDSLKGKGSELTKMVAAAGGNKDFEMEVRKALKGAGDSDAMIMNADQMKNEMATASIKEKQQMLKGIDKGVEIGPDGKPRQTHAADKLLALDKSDFDQFSQRLKQQVKDAMLLAAQVEVDPAKKQQLTDQFQKMTGESALDPSNAQRSSDLLAAMEGRGVAARAQAMARGEETVAPMEKRAREILGENMAQVDTESLYKALDAAQDGNVDANMINAALSSLQTAGDWADATKGPEGGRDASGAVLSHGDVVARSQLVHDLKQALAAGDAKVAADHLRAASVAIENAAKGKLTAEPGSRAVATERAQQFEAAGRGVSAMKSAGSGFDKALEAVSDPARMKQFAKAASQALTSIDMMVKVDTVSPEIKRQLEELKQQINNVKTTVKENKSIDDAATTAINDIKQKMERLSGKVEGNLPKKTP
jgi:hypothetical protein